MLKHPLDGVAVLRGWGGCARAVGVGSGKERGARQRRAHFIGDPTGSGGQHAGGATRRRGVRRGVGPALWSGSTAWPAAARPRFSRAACV
jgi:hypothetical protein